MTAEKLLEHQGAILLAQSDGCAVWQFRNETGDGTMTTYNKLWFISESGKWKQGDHYVGCPEYGPFEWDFTHDSYRFTYFTNDIYYDGICPECGEKADHYSYTEFGTNEKGVSVSATETLYGNEKVTEADPYRDAEWAEANKSERIGIEETDIPTIILAEASSAREGVKLLLDIYENYGCVYASGVFVCDKDEVWYVENCSGTQYVAIKLNNNMIFLEPNMAVIGRVDLDDENVIASKDLIAVAKKAGTFVGDEAKNIIDFRASYARISEKMDQRMIDGLNYLNATYKYDSDALVADNTKFTISNLDASDKLVALYTNIKADRKLDKDDVFGYYKLSSIGKASNQEIEIFQLFKDRPVETATVGWVGVGNMSYNVFVPYYPMLIDSMYSGYQVSTASAKFTTEKPDTFCTYGTSWAQDAEGNWQRVSGFKTYPSNWKDSYYFTFEGLGGYIANAEKITGAPLKAEAKTYVADKLAALQQELYKDFVTTDELAKASDARALATENGKAMAEKAHKLGVELVEYITKDDALEPGHFTDVKAGAYYEDAVKWAVDKAVTSGKTVTTFAPNESCTRAQAVTFLWRAAGSPEPTASEMTFTDVKAGSYYYKAVLWAVENKITSGMSDTLFAPDATCSRSQIVTFLYRMQNSPESKAENPFTDVKADAYYANAVLWAVENGVTTGASATTFDPAGDCTRGQIVTFLYRCLSK
ncbi:C69 family dipeptidase [Hominicoprocola fusiformis]